MNQHIKYIKKRLEWLKDLEKELGCYTRQIEERIKRLEKDLKRNLYL